MDWWIGIAVGIGVMAVHAALRLLTHRLAGRYSGMSFLIVELGGLGGRMLLLMVAVALVLVFAPLSEVAFVGTVLFLLVLSIILEARLILREEGSRR